jgi:hypothetical protein
VNLRPLLAAALLMLSLTGCAPGIAVAAPRLIVPAAPPPASLPAAPTSPAASVGSGCQVLDGRADARCTPGVRNPQVTALNIASTICKSGWTATVRPAVSYTNRLKTQQMPRYGESGSPSLYEEDHLLPLELGGNPTDPANLWPEPWDGTRGAHVKDVEETSLKRAVCGGRVKLADAQTQILRGWTR